MKKPSVFRFQDFAAFALPALACWVLSIYVAANDGAIMLSRDGESHVLEGKILMFMVAAVFTACYVVILVLRKRFLDQFTIIPFNNVFINPGRMTASPDLFRDAIESTEILYNDALNIDAPTLVSKDPVWVTMQLGPFQHPNNRKLKLMGYTIVGGAVIVAGYRSLLDDPSKTALPHELGHVILGRWKESVPSMSEYAWDESDHHKVMAELKLP